MDDYYDYYHDNFNFPLRDSKEIGLGATAIPIMSIRINREAHLCFEGAYQARGMASHLH